MTHDCRLLRRIIAGILSVALVISTPCAAHASEEHQAGATPFEPERDWVAAASILRESAIFGRLNFPGTDHRVWLENSQAQIGSQVAPGSFCSLWHALKRFFEGFDDPHVRVSLTDAGREMAEGEGCGYDRPSSSDSRVEHQETRFRYGFYSYREIIWISFPTFQSTPWSRLLQSQATIDVLSGTASEKPVVVDLRGNSGGNTFNGDWLFRVIWGAAAHQCTDWVDGIAVTVDIQPERLGERAPSGRAARDDGGDCPTRDLTNAESGSESPSRAVYLITDGRCISACLQFLDRALEMPNATQIGAETGYDTIFGEVRSQELPSGLFRISYPIKAWPDRNRASGQRYTPVDALAFDFRLHNETEFMRWLDQLIFDDQDPDLTHQFKRLAAPYPRVIETYPDSTSTVESGWQTITVTFSEEMKRGSFSIVDAPGLATPNCRKAAFDETARTFELTCYFEPQVAYGFWINSPRFHNFQSADTGAPALPFLWVMSPDFSTDPSALDGSSRRRQGEVESP